MKFNKWTVALAAIGVVSMASAAKAEEKASTAVTALTPTSISGYVDTSAQWNFGTGNANLPPYKFGGAGKADGFNLDVVQLRIEKAMDESEWAAGYRADFWFGPDAKTLGTASQFSQLNLLSDFAIRQAYVALRTPVGNGIDWKMGVFDSILGYESVESPNDPNYTRSYGHSIEPQTHTGLLATYRFCDCFSASAGVANTMGPSINSRAHPTSLSVGIAGFSANVNPGGNYAESYKTYMGSIAYTAPDSMGFLKGSTLYAGAVSGFNSGVGMPSQNYYVGATIATPITGLRLGAAFDMLAVNTSFDGDKQEGEMYSIAAYASFQATEKLSFHGRFEYFSGDVDNGGLNFMDDNAIFATTATIQYDLWKNVLSRLEFRWDHAEHGKMFGGEMGDGTGVLGIPPSILNIGVPPTRENAFMLAANIIYKF